MRREYQRVLCPYCQKAIAWNRMTVHKSCCSQRIYKAPIETLTYGEAKASGRIKEFIREALKHD
jgi:hypothetical protein